jgi:hypothetical protein
MKSDVSVLQKATRLRAVAHTYAEGAKERRDREQAAVALRELEDALGKLEMRAEATRAAATLGVPVPDIAALVGRGLTNLEVKASDGLLPTKQTLQAARGKLTTNRTELEEALGVAWREWAAARIADIPTAKIALLDGRARQSIEDDLRSLRAIARMLPSAGDIQSFARKLTRVRNVLDALESDDDIIELLTRLGAPEGVVLTDLTDAELALLRGNIVVTDQIVLRRR